MDTEIEDQTGKRKKEKKEQEKTAEGKQGKRQTSHSALKNSGQKKSCQKTGPSSRLPIKLKSHTPIKERVRT
jgi:hypothetical protein